MKMITVLAREMNLFRLSLISGSLNLSHLFIRRFKSLLYLLNSLNVLMKIY